VTAPWTPLPWDTEFFGFSIGRLDLDGLDPDAIAAVEAEARAAGVQCLYGSLDPSEVQATAVVQDLGYRFVEAATLFSLRLDEPPIPRPEGIEVRVATAEDLPELTPIVESLAPWSRFAVDRRFPPDAAVRIQRAWAERATREPDGDYSMLVATDERGIIAFITRTVHPSPRVDGVGTTARGSGAARYLIEEARAWAGDVALLGGPIAARNIPCLRYVSHCGYRVSEVRYLYHRWLDEDPGAPA
jgi:hypothetical protein